MEGCVGCLMAILGLALLSFCISHSQPGIYGFGAVVLPIVMYYVIVNLVYGVRRENHRQEEERKKADIQCRAERVLARCYAVPVFYWKYEECKEGDQNYEVLRAKTSSGGTYQLSHVWTDSSYNLQVGGWSYSVQIEDGNYRFSDGCYQSWNYDRGGEGGDPIAKEIVCVMLSKYGKK